MSVPPLRLHHNFETFFSGEVIVHASAVIAPGVIMQAAPNSKIIIGSGVCIGMGSILQVDSGTLEIESGANLGAGFLMVGAGKIGANACIGSATTVFRSSVKPAQVVPPGSIIGDISRSFSEPSTKEMNGASPQPQLPVATESESVEKAESVEEANSSEEAESEILSNASISETYITPPVTPSPRPYVSPSPISYFSNLKDSTEETISSEDNPEKLINTEESNTEDNSEKLINTEDSTTEEPKTANSNGVGNHIYGRTNIKSLLITLFPHRQSLNTPVSDNES
ncbi:MAG: transferase [Cyanobacteria bacterium P01_D01_bin.50]